MACFSESLEKAISFYFFRYLEGGEMENKRKKTWAAFLLSLVLSLITQPVIAEKPIALLVPDLGDESSVAAHNPQGQCEREGPWFEGWYTRITDVDGKRSVAVIGASYLPAGMSYYPGLKMPGYLVVLVSEGDGSITRAYEVFPEDTTFIQWEEPVFGNSYFMIPGDFEWSAENYGYITQDMIDINIPGVLDISATSFHDPISWNSIIPGLGPEGFTQFLCLIPVHWYVFSLGSDADYYRLSIHGDSEDVILSGMGYVHQEKNWGKAFPPAWIWAEGINHDNTSQFALSGGKLGPGPYLSETWLVGFHSPYVHWDFRPSIPGTVFESVIDACSGYFKLTAKNRRRRLVIEATAPVETFSPVSIPTVSGFEPDGAVESFSATVEISAYWLSWFRREILIDRQFFSNAGLEFGSGFMCED